jgi:3'-phosphoadenosine 5'-phosphosulfate sulfotransferase (PAPS reductase)/FAD synthetase
MVFEQHRKHGIEPNPLYKQGMNRVGCMPCINVAKDELLEISKRFPDQIDRIEEWEALVSEASKRGNATFLPAPGDNETARERGNIRVRVQWAQTSRGGKEYDWVRLLTESPSCSSAYGLCE